MTTTFVAGTPPNVIDGGGHAVGAWFRQCAAATTMLTVVPPAVEPTDCETATVEFASRTTNENVDGHCPPSALMTTWYWPGGSAPSSTRCVTRTGGLRHRPGRKITAMSKPERVISGGGGHEATCCTMRVTASLDVGSGGSTEGGAGENWPKAATATRDKTAKTRTVVNRGSWDKTFFCCPRLNIFCGCNQRII